MNAAGRLARSALVLFVLLSSSEAGADDEDLLDPLPPPVLVSDPPAPAPPPSAVAPPAAAAPPARPRSGPWFDDDARERARRDAAAAREHARREVDRARRALEAARRERARRPPPAPPAPPPPPRGRWYKPFLFHHHHAHGHYHPHANILVVPQAVPVPAAPPPPPRDAPPARPIASEDRREPPGHGGLLAGVGASRWYGLVPLGSDLMAGARLQAVAGLPTSAGRWLSHAALGLSGGIDVGDRRGVDAQLWHAGAVFAIGAPWTRDVVGVGIEGGLLGGRTWDDRREIGDAIGTTFYGLGRLTLQVPLEGDVRPFLSGELGATERADGRPSGLAGINAGVVWNAW
jgi:hypothetical protein